MPADSHEAPRAVDARWRRLTIAGVALFAAFRIAELTTYALWYDELFSLSVAQQDWAELFRTAIADRTNPPLFYAMLKLWIGVGGESVAWLRLLPCLIGIGVAIPLAALARRMFEPLDEPGAVGPLGAACVTLAVGAASPLLVALANELRGYSLLLMASAISMLAFVRVVESAGWLDRAANTGDAPSWSGQAAGEHRRRVVQLCLASALLVYAHYFGWLLVGTEVVIALFLERKALKGTLLALAGAAVAFAPWALAVSANAAAAARPLENVSWIARPSMGDIPVFYDALVARVITPGTAAIGPLLILIPLAVLTVNASAPGGSAALRRRFVELCAFAALPVLTVFAASVLLTRSAFVPRYLIVVAPAWWLIVGMAAGGLGLRRWTGARALAAAGLLAAFTLAAGVMREVRGGEKIAWDAIVASVAADAGPGGGTVYSLEGFTALPLTYYAASAPGALAVRPVRNLSEMNPPAWLVVRSIAGADASLGAGLAPAGITLSPVYTSSVLSHSVTAYRVTAP